MWFWVKWSFNTCVYKALFTWINGHQSLFIQITPPPLPCTRTHPAETMTQLGGQCTLRASQFSQHLALWVISNTAQRQSTVSADGSIQQKVNKTGTKCKSKKLTPAVKDKHELHVNAGRHYRSSPAAAAINTFGLRCNSIRWRPRCGGRATSSHISNQHIFIKFDLTQSVTTLKPVTSSGDLTSRTLTCAPVLLRQACVLEETWCTVQADGNTEHTAVIQ